MDAFASMCRPGYWLQTLHLLQTNAVQTNAVSRSSAALAGIHLLNLSFACPALHLQYTVLAECR
uniref:Uncharacterized protein n=1 Tax=Arundo donax TaxID=35708 RepID=A0A0A8ZBW7_ARUDO